MISNLAERRARNEPRMLRELLYGFVDAAGKRSEGSNTAISTGTLDLDPTLNGGMRGGQLVIIAGHPAMGKTAFSTDIGLHVAESKSMLMFSMEMGS